MKTDAHKRESYSFFDFPSVLQRRRVRLESRALERVLIELETTPGVTQWRREDAVVPFVDGGKERTAKLQLAVSRKNAPRQLVQIIRGNGSDAEKLALDAAREYCARTQYEHVVVSERPAPGPFWELQNRLTAHAWLVQAQNWDTGALEERAAAFLRARPLRFSELAQQLQLTPLQARLVFLRCWLRDLVAWDITSGPLGQDLSVGTRHA